MTAKDLKNALLQEAVQGKLVPQIASEGNARDLLNEIKCQKAKLIADGKIKKEKPLPEITDDEIPFDIPENWCWCRFGDLCTIFGRIGFRGYTTNDLVSEGNGAITLSPSNMTEFGMNYAKCTYISWFKYEESPEIKIENEDILVVKTGSSYGKTCLVKNLPEKATINPQIIVLKYVLISKEYLTYVLCSPYAKSFFEELVKGTSIPTYSQASLAKVLIPLPPIAEQKRIVSKLEEMLPLVEEYGKAQEELDKLNNEIPEKLKKAILQEAIQGKLVPQIASEGNAQDLLQKIEAERKKSNPKYKPLPPVTDDEKPFEIPESWVWVRLGDIGYFVRGKGFLKRDFVKKGFPCLHYGQIHMIFNTATSKTITYISDEMAKKSGIASPQDVILAITSEDVEGSCKPVAWLGNYDIAIGAHTAIYKHSINALFLSYYFQTICFAKQKSQYTHGSKVVEIKPGDIANCFFPLPPLSEQKRIVAKLEELLGEVEKLKR